MDDSSSLGPGFEFLKGGGEMASRIARFDWSDTTVGPIENWSHVLKNIVAFMLRSPVPMVLLWGPLGKMIYNDSYAVFAGVRHPQLLGSKVLEGWPEVADFNAHVMDVVYHQGKTLSFRDQSLKLNRDGRMRKGWMDLDYSPVLDEQGNPAGVIAIVVETTQKVIAERWRTSELQRQVQMFEQAPGFMAMLRGPSHIFELANAGYRQLVGHRELLGRTVREAFPDIAEQGFYELLDQVYKSGKPFFGTALGVDLQRSPHDAVEQHYIDLVYQPIRNPDGDVIGILAQGIDVTQRLAAEQASKANEERFRTLAQVMPNQAWTADAGGSLNWFNQRVYEYSGTFPGELDGEKWAKLVHPDDFEESLKRWQQSLETGGPYETEFRLLAHDGSYQWYIARAIPIRDNDGAIIQWIGTNTNIDEQKRIAQQLAKSDRRFELSQNAAGIGSLELDIATGMVIGSEQFWRIWGLEPKESHHISVLENLVLKEDAHIRSNDETRAHGTASPHVEYRIKRANDGELRWVSRSVDFVFDDGKPVSMFGVMQDITERKEGEERLKTLAHELEHRIKNILAIVGSIASRTMNGAPDVKTGLKAFRNRLDALSTVHDVLNQTRWTNTSLQEVAERGIAPFDKDRVKISGPPIAITPKMAISMGLAINELGTNAVKYGALSVPDGHVEISWELKSGAKGSTELVWTWYEYGGPLVIEPAKKGFGTVLIENILGADFGGSFVITYDPAGVKCVLVSPYPNSK